MFGIGGCWDSAAVVVGDAGLLDSFAAVEIARIGGSDCKEFIINMMVSEGGMDKALVVMMIHRAVVIFTSLQSVCSLLELGYEDRSASAGIIYFQWIKEVDWSPQYVTIGQSYFRFT
ncbi:unnamed protein product [Heligmosomoides polygyrus]|uniref:Pentatricopeptide repeat-containing protein n=1 Tax=Heligmosomoides polygyrus TaxID=6339 RepID=A0A183GJP3_HELPZ|nr:unnamed protein product [Heligmosomoides polygyrus]